MLIFLSILDMLKSSTNQMSAQPPPYLMQSQAGQQPAAVPGRSPQVSVRSPSVPVRSPPVPLRSSPVSANSSFLQNQLLGISPPSRNTSIQTEIQVEPLLVLQICQNIFFFFNCYITFFGITFGR